MIMMILIFFALGKPPDKNASQDTTNNTNVSNQIVNKWVVEKPIKLIVSNLTPYC